MSSWDNRDEKTNDNSAPTELKIEKLQVEIKNIEEKTESEIVNAM